MNALRPFGYFGLDFDNHIGLPWLRDGGTGTNVFRYELPGGRIGNKATADYGRDNETGGTTSVIDGSVK